MSPGVWYTFGDGLQQLQNPLFIMGARDHVLEYDTEALPTLELHGSDPNYLLFPNTGHYGFTEMCAIIPAFSEECTDTTGAYTPSEELHYAMNAIVLSHVFWISTTDTRYKDWLETQTWPSSLLTLNWNAN